jgi:SWI/SNF-related matrix-associated actin-dependent regulator 1 of chromatin subfamily A
MFHRRRKLPPTLVISAKDEDTIRLTPRRLPNDVHDALVELVDGDGRRHRHYTLPIARYGAAQAFATARGIACDPIPTCVARLRLPRAPRAFDASRCGPVWDTLYDYQRDAIRRVVTVYESRALLADDMGLGKTRSGLAWLDLYKETPTLVLCPSYLRFHWAHGIQEHLGKEAAVLRQKKRLDVLETSNVHIVSYDMLHGLPARAYATILCDESHYLKNRLAKRTKAAMPLLKRAAHVLLLSGTPALNRPVELFTQLHALRPRWFPTYTKFAYRYCAAKLTQYGLDVRGASNQDELHFILSRGLMIRRRKEDLLDLPPKTRETWRLELPRSKLKDIERGWSEWHRLNDVLHQGTASDEAKSEAFFQRKSLMSEMMRQTCTAKKAAVQTFVADMVARDIKFLFFAFHQEMLDAVEEVVTVDHIRIDGATPAERRPELVRRFQEEDSVRCAILSIGAANAGITLTAASVVVMGELHWTPGILLQCEDRAHRISQTADHVVIHYLIGARTLDERVYPMLTEKLKHLDAVVDNTTARSMQGETTHVQELDDTHI